MEDGSPRTCEACHEQFPAPPPYVDDEGNELCQACADQVAREDGEG